MEQLSSVLAASIILFSIASSLIFAFAEGGATAAMTLPIGLLAWFVCERDDEFRLPKIGINLLGFAAVVMAGYELYLGSIEARLLAGGHLIVYLSWLFLFHVKEPRPVWWLTALAVLQVAIASVLTSAPWFGAALIGWLLIGMWTMAIFTMQRSAARTLHQEHGLTDLVFSDSAPREAAGQGDRSYCLNGLRPDERFRLLSGRFVASVAAITLAGIVIALLFFVFIPRVWMSRLRLFDDTALAGRKIDGFTERVRLGDIGEIMANNDVALTATFREMPGGKRMNTEKAKRWLGDSPLFRARTLEDYTSGKWDPYPPQLSVPSSCDPAPRDQPLICTDISLNGTGSTALFTIGQVKTCETQLENCEIKRRRLTREYFRNSDQYKDSFRYQVFSFLEKEDEFNWSHSVGKIGSPQATEGILEYNDHVRVVPEGLPNVARITREVLATLPPMADDEHKAEALLTYLRDSGRYEYTLKASVSNLRIDPVEDFLVNRKQGHCEYFASAYALLLRAAGIPSRLVTGFKGGKFEGNSGTFVVQQRFAHAWVEARLGDYWITMDPTPAIRDTKAKAAATIQQSFTAAMQDLMVRMWISGIGMNSQQQREQVYLPMQRLGQRAWQRLIDLWGRFHTIWSGAIEVIRSPDQWISWRGGLTAFGLLTTLAVFWRVSRSLLRRIRGFGRRKTESDESGQRVPFYERYKAILETAGLIPERSQTASEFGASAGRMLNRQLEESGLTALPAAVCDEFYRVRFGGETLTPLEEDRVERRLWRLEACLSAHASVNSNSHDLRSR